MYIPSFYFVCTQSKEFTTSLCCYVYTVIEPSLFSRTTTLSAQITELE